MSSHSSLLCYCLLGLIAITIGMPAAEESQKFDDELKEKIDELKIAIKHATAVLEELRAAAVDLTKKAKEGRAKQFLSFLQELSGKYFNELPVLKYYLNHKDCLTPEHTQNLIYTFHNGILHSGKSCIYKQNASDTIDKLQLSGDKVTAFLKQNVITAPEEKCSENDNLEKDLLCFSDILWKMRIMIEEETNLVSIWKLALADYLTDDSALAKSCYNQIPAQAKAKYEAILNQYCQPPPKNK